MRMTQAQRSFGPSTPCSAPMRDCSSAVCSKAFEKGCMIPRLCCSCREGEMAGDMWWLRRASSAPHLVLIKLLLDGPNLAAFAKSIHRILGLISVDGLHLDISAPDQTKTERPHLSAFVQSPPLPHQKSPCRVAGGFSAINCFLEVEEQIRLLKGRSERHVQYCCDKGGYH